MKTQERGATKVCRTCGEEKASTEYYPRYATCKACGKIRYKAKADQYYQDNAKKICDRTTANYHDNKDRYTAGKQEWREANPGRDSLAQKTRRNANLEKQRLYDVIASGERRARIRQAMPSWADTDKISAIYAEAQKIGYHVDHIVPLKGKLVSGLHCEDNLQVISPHENLVKHNTFSV